MTASPAVADEGKKKGHLFGFEFPDFSVLKDHNVQTIIYAKNVQKLGIATLSYGGAIFLAQKGASQIEISLVAVSGYVASLLFGAQGGTVVDKTEKRTAMCVAYLAMAVLCILWPSLVGTEVIDLVVLAFLVAILATVTSPAIKATVALVSTPAAMATVAAVLGLFGSLGTAIGQAFVAPILIKISGIDACMYGAGIILATGGIWSLKVPKESGVEPPTQAVKETDWKPHALELRSIARWVMSNQRVATIVLVGSIVAALGETVNSLIPIYVRDVLDTDPANSVYVFAPAGLGYLAGTIAAPSLIKKYGQRRVGFGAFLVTAIGVMMFGFVDALTPIFAPISPSRLFNLLPGVDLSDPVLAAGFIAMPANFGSTATSASVQNFVNARVPLISQGGVFGMEEVVDNILTIAAVLSMGVLATAAGTQAVMVIAPLAVLAIVVWLIRYSFRTANETVPGPVEVVEELWSGPPRKEGPESETRATGDQ